MIDRFDGLKRQFHDPLLENEDVNTFFDNFIPQTFENEHAFVLMHGLQPIDEQYKIFYGEKELFDLLRRELSEEIAAHLIIISLSKTFEYHLNKGIDFYGLYITQLLKGLMSYSPIYTDESKIAVDFKRFFTAHLYKGLRERITELKTNKNIEFVSIYKHCTSKLLLSNLTEQKYELFSDSIPTMQIHLEHFYSRSDDENFKDQLLGDILIYEISEQIELLDLNRKFVINGKLYRILGWIVKYEDGTCCSTILSQKKNGGTVFNQYIGGKFLRPKRNYEGSLKNTHLKSLYLEYLDPEKECFASFFNKKKQEYRNKHLIARKKYLNRVKRFYRFKRFPVKSRKPIRSRFRAQ